MKQSRFSNLLEKDFHIVEKRKLIFGIPIAILVVALVMMLIFHFTLGSALNLGTDFTGGYSVDVQLGNKLTDSNRQTYFSQIEKVLNNVTDEEGNKYSVSVSGTMQIQGSGSKSTIHVRYSAVPGMSESEMANIVNPAVISALEKDVLNKIPTVAIDGSTITVTYDEVINDYGDNSPLAELKDMFMTLAPSLGSVTVNKSDIKLNPENGKQLLITVGGTISSSPELIDSIVGAMSMPDVYAGRVVGGSLVGATVSTQLLFTAILAVSLALIFMLCYIGLRFQLSSGLACIIALFHDLIIVFASMAIFHIEINSTFIAAIITILGYSINNSIILFDRVREKMHSVYSKSMTPEAVANGAIKDTLLRSINTTITTLIMITMVAILGVRDIQIFAFPIIIGLIAGAFSSICIAPSFWALFQRVGKNRENFNFGTKNKENKKAVKTTEVNA